MKNLLPHFIQDQFQQGNFEGDFQAFSMFVDISGFTQMTETLMKEGHEGAEILSSILNNIFEPSVDAIYELGGFISTFVGDGFTALFPIPSKDAFHTLACAETIQTIFEKNRIQKTKFGEFTFGVKIGLSYGQVEWGIVGKTQKAYFFRGEAIDACTRSEHHAEKGDIVLDEPLLQNIPSESLGLEEINQHYFKLKSIGEKFVSEDLPQIKQLPPIKEEIASHFLPAPVIGFSQIGEFRNVVSVFLSFDGISTHEQLDQFVQLLFDVITPLSGYLNKIDFGDKGHVVLCGFGVPTSFENNRERALSFKKLDAKLRYENTLDAFKTLFETLSRINPLILEIEDLHWIESDSVKAFEHLCRRMDAFPILLIVTSRYRDDGSKPTLPVEIPIKEVELSVFSQEEIRPFAESGLQGPLAPSLLEYLETKTQGNPFFMEQTLLYFKEEGIIEFREQREESREQESGSSENLRWTIVKEESAIPTSINDLLIARVDRLSDQLKEITQTASVLGYEFDIHLLSEVLKQIDPLWQSEKFDQQLKTGETQQIWSMMNDLRYLFSHALLQDAVYRMQLKSRLRRLHKLVAETLEQLYPEDKNHYEDLAFHYDHAEKKPKTLEYLRKAGEFAQESYQNEKALAFYDRLLSLFRTEWDIPSEDHLETWQVPVPPPSDLRLGVDILYQSGEV